MNLSSAEAISLVGLGIVVVALIGAYYLIATSNLVRMLIAIELLMKAATLAIVLGGYVSGKTALAQSLVVTLIVVEVVVMIVANGIILCIYKNNGRIDSNTVESLRG